MRDGLGLLLGRLIAVLSSLEGFAERDGARVPASRYTHFQPAQLTTVGKRATLWMQDLVLDVEELCHRIETLPLPRLQGHHRHAGLFLELFDGDHAKVRELERRVTAKLGFREQFAVTGQTYTRKVDAQVLDALSGVAQSAAKFAADLRLLQHEGEIVEPFEAEQIGSSAMAYKRNPMRAERISALARFVISLQAERRAHRGGAVARAHARRQRQPAAHAAGGVPRHRRDPGARHQHRGRARGAGGRDPAASDGADAVHGDRALAHARRRAPAATGRRCTR